MRDTVLALGTTLVVQALVSMAVLTVPVLAPAAAADVQVSTGYVGLFIALVYGGGMSSSVASGDLIRKLGAIRVSQICLVLCAAGLAVTAVGSASLFVFGALLLGAGYGPVTPASTHILARSTPPHMMSFFFSLKQTGVPIGGAMAGALVPPLVLLGGWRGSAVAVAAACLGVAVMAQSVRRKFDGDRDPTRRVGARGVLSSMRIAIGAPAVRRLAACSFFFSSVQLCLITYLVTYLTSKLGLSLIQAGLMLSAAQGAGIIARVAWGALADSSGRPVVVLGLLACGMAIASVATALLSPEWSSVVIALVCASFGATAIGWNGIFLAEVVRRAPAGKAVEATGGALFFTYFGVLVAPPLFALTVENGGSYGLAYCLLALPPLACGLWLLSGRMGTGHSSESATSLPEESI